MIMLGVVMSACAVLIVYYDRIRTGRVIVYESVFMWASCGVSMYLALCAEASLCEWCLGVLIGACAAGLERTLFGVAFHLVHSYEVEHEKYHARLRQKFLVGSYVASDDRFEVITYSVVFLLWFGLLWFILPPSALNSSGACFFVGLTLEHWGGQRLRGAIQYNRLHKNKNLVVREWTRRFEINIEVYYFYHLLIHPQMCAGFSSPFWDTLLGRNPFASRVPYFNTLPIPFLDFLFVDYSAYKPQIERAWLNYTTDPVAFEQLMLTLSAEWRASSSFSSWYS